MVRLPVRSSGSTTATSTASPWCTSAGEVEIVTSAACAAPGQLTGPSTAVSSSVPAHRRPRRVILMVVPIRLDAAGSGAGHTR
ncbi:hypothetical protein MRQ36_32670 [Micromonospora sp. R77]|uniref:hypothetical protein n=1 Tax=Micromonospora sp. R77 TaxID=2925836 RepID=UPI001F610D91|nr:hypothetical protein [Micromonospora sp. R77]MCI4067065.1 hypothetical protein [Micromonospora sp. R77]